MTWDSHPVTPERFEDFVDVVNRSRRANHCWCLAHRLRTAEIEELDGAVAYAAAHGAPAVEAYPVDPPGRMDLTMAFVGTTKMFLRAGFRIVGTTDAVASGMPRLIMRRDLS